MRTGIVTTDRTYRPADGEVVFRAPDPSVLVDSDRLAAPNVDLTFAAWLAAERPDRVRIDHLAEGWLRLPWLCAVHGVPTDLGDAAAAALSGHEDDAPAEPGRVSIVIPVFNKVEYTRRCIDSLFAVGLDDLDEVIVVDNASTDGTAAYLAALGDRVRVVTNDRNLNFARACNQGAALARGYWLMMLNNDTEVSPGWLDRLIGEAEETGAGIVGARLHYPDGRIQHAGVTVEHGIFPRHLHRFQPGDTPEARESFDCQMVTGACMLVDRAAFASLGGFDEVFINGCEDCDFCFRAREEGVRVRYCGAVEVVHHESVSPGRNDHDEANAVVLRNRWFTRLHADRVSGDRILSVADPELTWRRGTIPVASIVIPLYNKVELTRQCIDSIDRIGLPDDVEVVLVDNASTDGTREYCDSIAGKWNGRLRIYRLSSNRDFAGACNFGAAHSMGDALVFLNNDTVVTEGWIDSLLAPLADPRVGIVGARLLYPDGTLQHGGVAFDEDRIGRHINAGAPGDDPVAMQPRAMQAVTGACLAIDRGQFYANVFDTAYRNGLEDVELCLRIRTAGLLVWYEPECVVYHHESQSEGRFDHARENILLFMERWGAAIVPDQLTFATSASELARTGFATEPQGVLSSSFDDDLDSVVLVGATADSAHRLLRALDDEARGGRRREVVLVTTRDEAAPVEAAVRDATGDIGAVRVTSCEAVNHGAQGNVGIAACEGSRIVVAPCDEAMAPYVRSTLASLGENDPLLRAPRPIVAVTNGGEVAPVVGLTRHVIEAAGGLDVGFETLSTQVCDLVHRAALHGFPHHYADAALCGLRPVAAGGNPIDAARFDRRWVGTDGLRAARDVALYQPLVERAWTGQEPSFETRSRAVLLPYATGDDASFLDAARIVLAALDAADDVTIVVRAGVHADAAAALLEQALDGVPDERVPDIVLAESTAADDEALVRVVDAVVCTGPRWFALHGLARHRGARPLLRGDLAELRDHLNSNPPMRSAA